MKILRNTRWLAGLPSTPEFNVLVFSYLLNLAWEVWQVPFFQGMADQPHWEGVKACTQAKKKAAHEKEHEHQKHK